MVVSMSPWTGCPSRGRLGLALAVCLGLPVLGPAAEAAVLDRIAAVVNNDVITLSEVQEESLPQIQKITKDYVESEQDAQLAKVYREFLDQTGLVRGRLAKGEPVSCALCHSLEVSFPRIARTTAFSPRP